MAGIAVVGVAHQHRTHSQQLAARPVDFAVFVHLDARCDAGALSLPDRARLIAPRREVFWGGWSMMEATVALIEAAGPGYDRYVLLSGDSLPVRPPETLRARLRDPAQEFIELLPVADDPSLAGADPAEAERRHGWVQPWRFQNQVEWDHLLLNPRTRAEAARHYGIAQDRADFLRGEVAALVAPLLPPRRRLFASYWYGMQWWALTGATMRALAPLLRDAAVRDFFRHMQVPDEHMIQTLLGDRPELLAGRAVGAPVWTDLAARRAGEDRLDDAGFARAAGQGAQILFARKFDPAFAPGMAARFSPAPPPPRSAGPAPG